MGSSRHKYLLKTFIVTPDAGHLQRRDVQTHKQRGWKGEQQRCPLLPAGLEATRQQGGAQVSQQAARWHSGVTAAWSDGRFQREVPS